MGPAAWRRSTCGIPCFMLQSTASGSSCSSVIMRCLVRLFVSKFRKMANYGPKQLATDSARLLTKCDDFERGRLGKRGQKTQRGGR